MFNAAGYCFFHGGGQVGFFLYECGLVDDFQHSCSSSSLIENALKSIV